MLITHSIGLTWAPRYGRSFLTNGMKKRRIAFATKHGKKNKAWWRGVAFQGEGHIDPWVKGPSHVWALESEVKKRRLT